MILIFIKCNSSSRDNSIIIIKALIRIIVYDVEVINNYSNKSFYNYYAVIPRGTISFYLNKDHLLQTSSFGRKNFSVFLKWELCKATSSVLLSGYNIQLSDCDIV